MNLTDGGHRRAFQALILREFLLEDRLSGAFNYAAVASWLGELANAPSAVAVEYFLSENVRRFLDAGMTQQAIVDIVQIKNSTLRLRSASELLAVTKSLEDNYDPCCRSALCHAVHGSWEWAFGAYEPPPQRKTTHGRGTIISMELIHGARGAFEKAVQELERAAGSEPYPEPQRRIAEALELARTWAKTNPF